MSSLLPSRNSSTFRLQPLLPSRRFWKTNNQPGPRRSIPCICIAKCKVTCVTHVHVPMCAKILILISGPAWRLPYSLLLYWCISKSLDFCRVNLANSLFSHDIHFLFRFPLFPANLLAEGACGQTGRVLSTRPSPSYYETTRERKPHHKGGPQPPFSCGHVERKPRQGSKGRGRFPVAFRLCLRAQGPRSNQ